MSQQPTRSGALVGLLHAVEYLAILAGLYALDTFLVFAPFVALCLYLLAVRFWRWCRTSATPLAGFIAPIVAAFAAGAPFLLLLALAVYFK